MTKRVAVCSALCAGLILMSACADKRGGRSKGTEITEAAYEQDAEASRDTTTGEAADSGASGSAGSSQSGSGANPSNEPCRPVKSPEEIPNRLQAVNFDGGESQRAVFTRDLFSMFKTHCGACHVDTDLGNFRVKEGGLFDVDTHDQQDVILHTMTSDDPEEFMPPPEASGMPYSMRPEGDPIRELQTMMQLWFENGSPLDLFYVPTPEVAEPGYRLSESVAMSLTNMGNCVPDKKIVGEQKPAMDDLDTFFAGLKELPPLLSQTDLVTFDTEALARQRVLSFSPTYPLFSDNARKMRHVRVPRGQTLAFDRETQQFSVPPNTRVYKTFFKQIKDINGDVRYKKIETRIIVSRPDGPDGPNGEHETHSLYGSYQWNESETEAFLITDPLRNGKPFRDRLITYVTDEQKAQEVLDANPLDKVVALQESGAVRSYAIPGSDRCVQCHMGAENGSFVIGLSPMQLRARPKGEGGVIEKIGEDELNQLPRFIEYGLISGMKGPEDVQKLEDSQDTRKPRNKFELSAQGYMLGNCAYCHNPRGFPTTQNPELKNLLNFAPSKLGGIFQFPLDRTSPRIRRGLAQDEDIPYISPSLIDHRPDVAKANYVDKFITDGKDNKSAVFLAAPWRSLIYRNIDTPFPYSDDYALFPRMPMNAPGYDCRAPRIFGDWMVSIPAKRIVPKNAELGPDKKPILPLEVDLEGQTFVEVKPGDADYAEAEAEAEKRMNAWHGNFTQLERDESKGPIDPKTQKPVNTSYLAGYRSTLYCPDTSDIVDSSLSGKTLVPQDALSSLPSMYHDFSTMAKDPAEYIPAIVKFANASDGVPDKPHWVVTDITDAPGDWYPRRTDWDKVLVTRDSKQLPPEEERVVTLLQDRKLTEGFRKLVTERRPFAIWKDKPECDLSAQRTVDSYKGSERMRWLDRAYEGRPAPKPTERVYTQSYGEAIYNEICVNCHGPSYDSRGRQADTLMIMTGGDTRVANFRGGLFGPAEDPHANVERIFQPFAKADVTADDWAARYLAWMGLGGTQRTIPPVIMNVVSTLAVFGEKRPTGLNLTQNGANMLAIASMLCEHTLGLQRTQPIGFDPNTGILATREPLDKDDKGTALLDISGDYEMWMQICRYDNPTPVRVVQPRPNGWTQYRDLGKPMTFFIWGVVDPAPTSWYKPESYPPSTPIGDHLGRTRDSLEPDNEFPWCLIKPTDPTELLIAGDYVGKERKGRPFPWCPETWQLTDSNKMTLEDIDTWTTRGAINAGFAVYSYLEQLARDSKQGGKPQPAFDRCEQLKK